MKKSFLFILLAFLLISYLTFRICARKIIAKGYPVDRLANDPNTISEKQFYQYEHEIISGSSGSGGYFLDEPDIDWLKKAEYAFKAKGVKLKDKYPRHFVIAYSYFNMQKYDKALKEFRNIKDQEGVELVEWFISNGGIKNGLVKIKEYPGKIPWDSSEITKVEDKNYLFISYFKGPVYRYDKKSKKHAIIYAPEDEYDWCDALASDGRNLVIKLRDDAGIFVFDNEKLEISQFVKCKSKKQIKDIKKRGEA